MFLADDRLPLVRRLILTDDPSTELAALADLEAALAAVFLSAGPQAGGTAVLAVVLALLVHAGSKSLTAGLVGGWRYLAWLAPGLWVHSLLAAAGIWWLAGR